MGLYHASAGKVHLGLYSIDRSLPLTPELSALADEAYALFRPYTIGSALIVCHCNVCVDAQTERLLVATPLREMPAKLLAEYTNSAHTWDDGQVAREMRYFLPRYLELVALNDPPDSMGIEICLRRLRDACWRAKWPAAESALIDRFFDALVRGAMERLDVIPWSGDPDLKADMNDILTLIVTADGDIERALRVWDDGPPLGSALHLAKLCKRVAYKRGRDLYINAHLEDFPEASQALAAFLLRSEVAQRIEAAFFATSNTHHQTILSNAAA